MNHAFEVAMLDIKAEIFYQKTNKCSLRQLYIKLKVKVSLYSALRQLTHLIRFTAIYIVIHCGKKILIITQDILKIFSGTAYMY